MRFAAMKGCQRPVREQRYIHELLNNWESLPQERKMELRGLVDVVAVDPTEARALWENLMGRPPEAVTRRTGVSVRRIYALKCRYFEQVKIR